MMTIPKKVKVYVLTYCYDCGPGDVEVIGVYWSKEDAESAIRRLNLNSTDITQHEIEGVRKD